MMTYQPLETVIRTPPLGLRCLDVATHAPVTAGLQIIATPRSGAVKQVAATPTISGIHAFQGLPGLHDWEYGLQSLPLLSPPITSPPDRKEFAIQLEDTRGLYLAWGLVLTLPRAGILTRYVFSAPGRHAVPGFIAIRGGLKDKSLPPRPDGTLQPAAFAYIKAQYTSPSPSVEYLAMADARGQFALFLPSPNPLTPPPGVSPSSPNTASRRTIAELTWPLTLTFFYQPARQNFLCTRADGRLEIIEGQRPGITDAPPSQSGVRCVPDQPSLAAQAAASVYSSTSAPAAVSLPANMAFGKDLVVSTAGAGSDLWIEPQPLSPP